MNLRLNGRGYIKCPRIFLSHHNQPASWLVSVNSTYDMKPRRSWGLGQGLRQRERDRAYAVTFTTDHGSHFSTEFTSNQTLYSRLTGCILLTWILLMTFDVFPNNLPRACFLSDFHGPCDNHRGKCREVSIWREFYGTVACADTWREKPVNALLNSPYCVQMAREFSIQTSANDIDLTIND